MNSILKNLAVTTLLAATLVGGISLTAAGRIGGSGNSIERVMAGGIDTFFVDFAGGRMARVVVDGDGDTDLDLYVYDQWGNMVAYDSDMTDYCVVSFVPRFTGRFEIRIVNRGGVYNQYQIMTN